MKKLIQWFFILLWSYNIAAAVVSIGIPQSLYTKNSALMIYMQDKFGKELVGKCGLSETNSEQIISQNALQITEISNISHIDPIADITHVSTQSEQVVILHIELDASMKVLKVLVVQDSFLADTMFDVFTLTLSEQNEFESNHHAFAEFDGELDALDAFEKLAEQMDSQTFDKSAQASSQSYKTMLQQCVVYAEIYMLMQYGRVKRAMQSWFTQ